MGATLSALRPDEAVELLPVDQLEALAERYLDEGKLVELYELAAGLGRRCETQHTELLQADARVIHATEVASEAAQREQRALDTIASAQAVLGG